jgi:HSP20 family protein
MFSLIPWRERGEVSRFGTEMDKLFDRFFESGTSPWTVEGSQWVPSVDVSETGKKVIVKAEIPGMDPKDIDISVNGNRLTLRGERKHEHEEKGENFHRMERSYGAFSRTIELPAEIDSNKVEATYKKGVLKVTLPKTKESPTKKIEVKSA